MSWLRQTGLWSKGLWLGMQRLGSAVGGYRNHPGDSKEPLKPTVTSVKIMPPLLWP